MENPFHDVDWSKPNAELAVDLQIVTSGDYVGYTAWSKRLGPPDPESDYFVWGYGPTKDWAIEDVLWRIYERFAPGDARQQVAA